jgi:hypothetical protein
LKINEATREALHFMERVARKGFAGVGSPDVAIAEERRSGTTLQRGMDTASSLFRPPRGLRSCVSPLRHRRPETCVDAALLFHMKNRID